MHGVRGRREDPCADRRSFFRQARGRRWLGGNKQLTKGADWKSASSWWGGGWRAIEGRKNGNHDHLSVVADGAVTQRIAGQLFVDIPVVGFVEWWGDSSHRQNDALQLSAEGELGLAMTMAQKTVVTSALKTVRQ